MQLFVQHGVWEQLASQPELIPMAIEESMRLAPVTQFVVRIPEEDVIIDGHLFPSRRRIILNLVAASRDPAMFPEPDRFDLSRDNLTRSRLPFGWGTHLCLGHALARATMREAVAALTTGFTDVTIMGDVELAPAGAMLRGPEHLNLEFRSR